MEVIIVIDSPVGELEGAVCVCITKISKGYGLDLSCLTIFRELYGYCDREWTEAYSLSCHYTSVLVVWMQVFYSHVFSSGLQ